MATNDEKCYGTCTEEKVVEGTIPNAGRSMLETENYIYQQSNWPEDGQHIIAHYDDDTVIVYQAFKPSIGDFAVKNQRFGGADYSFTRMSWIKTNFLWMMYRCGWASKLDQEKVLAIRIRRSGFDEILSKAFTPKEQKSQRLEKEDIEVRLQWDPDHTPQYTKCMRRAIQLGLKGQILEKFNSSFIVEIIDMTDFVKKQKEILDKRGEEHIMIPIERVYPVTNPKTAELIGVSQ